MDLMRLYIDNGRFGEFVSEFIRLETKRKNEDAQKEENNKLWSAYIHSYSEKTFNEWKDDVTSQIPVKSKHTRETILKNEKIQRLMNRLNINT